MNNVPLDLTPVYTKILLINPWEGELFPPPSIGYLQGAIKHIFKDRVSVQSRDLSESLKLLSIQDFDLVGVSFHSFSVLHAKKIRSLVKPTTQLICGGHHPSSLPLQMLDIGFNQVVIGPGENAIIDIICGLKDKIVYSNNSYFKTINDIPLPDYTGLHGQWTNPNSEYGYPIISSRGCPFTCNFCASSKFWNKKIFMRSVESVIHEIIYNIENYGMKNWMFEDDNFTLNKTRVIEICKRIVTDIIPKYGRLNWQCASRAESLIDSDLCKSLINAGCTKVWLGVESFSQSSLDRCEKHTTTEKMINGIETAENLGLRTMSQFIIGLPGDTIDDIFETSRIIKKTRMSYFGGNIAWVLPGTNIYDKSKEKGFNENHYIEHGAPFYTYEQNMETLNRWKYILDNSK